MEWGIRSMGFYVAILILAAIVSVFYCRKLINDTDIEDIFYVNNICIINE